MFAEVGKRSTKILCDTGAACNCMSLEFYNKMVIKPVLKPYIEGKPLEAANNAALEVLGCVDVDVCVEGLCVPVDFVVIKKLKP